ncbi:MAG: OmpP1/FadL family transporter [Elusimicrobiales bacterium]|nr:OmpP1/FadL family transporter [Elusimicrobiales bacterium]
MFKTIAIVLALAGSVNAAGFRQANQSASANGMGTAFTAVANDASAVWYNPAALTDLSGTNLSIGDVFVDPRTEHTSADGTTIDRPDNMVHSLPHVYATHKINNKFAVGLGVLVPYGLSTSWDDENSLTRKVATESSLKALYSNLNIAYKVNDKLSVAAGASFVKLDASMNKMVTVAGLQTVEQTLKGDGTAAGYNMAAMYKWNKWNFAANYHSQVKVDIDGTMQLPLTGILAGNAVDDDNAKTEITLPDTFQLAAAYKHGDKWLFSAEADYTDWTTYRQLDIAYTNASGVASVSHDYKYWNSVWAFRVGTEYKVNDTWKLRAGSYYDNTPVQDNFFETRNACSDRFGVSVGAGYPRGNLSVDVSYLYQKFLERRVQDSMQDNGITGGTTVLNGKYNTTARLPALTVNYKF